MNRVKVGVIGCGSISTVYLQNCREFEVLDLHAVADIDYERAKLRASEFDIPHAYTVEELLNDPEVQIVINLTIPNAHAEVCLAALEAGKHVHVEKPLAITVEDGHKILDLARERGLRVGVAPDTVLGGGIQTCRKLIDEGWIGRPVAATAFMMARGPERWHPSPEFYYQVGGGPMFDMGPYYLTALITLLGPIRRVTGSAKITFPERTIRSKPKFGQKIVVETPTHVAGVFDFVNGAIATLVTSFDICHAQLPNIEIYGSQGTLRVPDPNNFGGPVKIRRRDADDWSEIPLTHGFSDNSRGLAVADMAYAILGRRQHRANGDIALHVLEAMHGVHIASDEGTYYTMKTQCEQPTPLPVGFSIDNMGDLFA